eukprot:5932833-Pyramimonas_sp.AAC.1
MVAPERDLSSVDLATDALPRKLRTICINLYAKYAVLIFARTEPSSGFLDPRVFAPRNTSVESTYTEPSGVLWCGL